MAQCVPQVARFTTNCVTEKQSLFGRSSQMKKTRVSTAMNSGSKADQNAVRHLLSPYTSSGFDQGGAHCQELYHHHQAHIF